MKIKFILDDELALNKTIKIPTMTIELLFLIMINIIYKFA